MTVSMRVMSAGDGYKYLLRTVAAGRRRSDSLDAVDEVLRGGGHPTRGSGSAPASPHSARASSRSGTGFRRPSSSS